MKMTLTGSDFEQIQRWMLRCARPLEQAQWDYHFNNGPRSAVIRALSAFQNVDGGFGHALEADCFNPESSSLQTWTACTILEEIGAAGEEAIVEQLLTYLRDGPDFTGVVWRSTKPSNNDHPHAPWWGWESDAASFEAWGYNPSAALAGYILRWASKEDSLYERAIQVARGAMADALSRGVDPNRHLTTCHQTLCQSIQAAMDEIERDETFSQWAAFTTRVRENTVAAIGRDPSRWFVSYATLPTDLIQSPEDPLYTAEKSLVDTALNAILAVRDADGIWDVSWAWDAYPHDFAVSRQWWRGVIALQRVMLLNRFGRVRM